MKAQELLAQIRPIWLQRALQSLTRGVAREAFLGELNWFYDGLEQAVMTGNPAWLDLAIYEWTASPTLSDLQQNQQKVSETLDSIIAITNDIVIETLTNRTRLTCCQLLHPFIPMAWKRLPAWKWKHAWLTSPMNWSR